MKFSIQNGAVEDHVRYFVKVLDALKWIFIDDEQVSVFTNFDGPYIFPVFNRFSWPLGAPLNDLHGREPAVLGENLHFVMNSRTWESVVPAVCADKDVSARFDIHLVEPKRIPEAPFVRFSIPWSRMYGIRIVPEEGKAPFLRIVDLKIFVAENQAILSFESLPSFGQTHRFFNKRGY